MVADGSVVALALLAGVCVTYGVDSLAERAGSDHPSEWAAGAFALVVGAALLYVQAS